MIQGQAKTMEPTHRDQHEQNAGSKKPTPNPPSLRNFWRGKEATSDEVPSCREHIWHAETLVFGASVLNVVFALTFAGGSPFVVFARCS